MTQQHGSNLNNSMANLSGKGSYCNCEANVLLVDDDYYKLQALKNLVESTEYEMSCRMCSSSTLIMQAIEHDLEKTCCQIHLQILILDLSCKDVNLMKLVPKVEKLYTDLQHSKSIEIIGLQTNAEQGARF